MRTTFGQLGAAPHRMPSVCAIAKSPLPAERALERSDPLAARSLPMLLILPAVARTDAVVLILHGGRSHSDQPTSARQLAYRRMVPIARAAHRAVGHAGTAVWLVRNRVRGWNEPVQDALIDARWALDELRRRHPKASVVVVGHSMGGRAALRVADADGVVAVCALAPWIEPSDPIRQLAGRTVLIAHGDRDRWTDPVRSYDYARRARLVTPRVCRFEVRGAGHAMLRRGADWTGLVRTFVAGAVGATSPHPVIVAGLRAPAPDGLRLPLPVGVW